VLTAFVVVQRLRANAAAASAAAACAGTLSSGQASSTALCGNGSNGGLALYAGHVNQQGGGGEESITDLARDPSAASAAEIPFFHQQTPLNGSSTVVSSMNLYAHQQSFSQLSTSGEQLIVAEAS